MGYEIHYKEGEDEKAIADTKEYLGDEKFDLLVQCFQDTTKTIDFLNHLMGFAGVTGLPFYAMCRKYRNDDFEAWCKEQAA